MEKEPRVGRLHVGMILRGGTAPDTRRFLGEVFIARLSPSLPIAARTISRSAINRNRQADGSRPSASRSDAPDWLISSEKRRSKSDEWRQASQSEGKFAEGV